jgi:hypothetical protein
MTLSLTRLGIEEESHGPPVLSRHQVIYVAVLVREGYRWGLYANESLVGHGIVTVEMVDIKFL